MGLSHSPRIVTDGLVLCLDAANPKSYPGTGTTWTDLSSNAYSITAVNGVGYSSSNGGYLTFDGLDDHCHTNVTPNNFAWTPNGSIGMQSMSIEMWVQSSDTTGRFYTKPWNGSGQYNVWIDPGYFYLLTDTASKQINFGRTLSNGTWTHLVVWADNVNMGYYINGDEYSSSQAHTLIGDIPSSGNNETKMGLMTLYPYGTGWGGNTTHAIEGNLAVAKIYNTVLSSERVIQNFNALRGRFGI